MKSPRVKMLLHLCTAIAATCILIIATDFVKSEEVIITEIVRTFNRLPVLFIACK